MANQGILNRQFGQQVAQQGITYGVTYAISKIIDLVADRAAKPKVPSRVEQLNRRIAQLEQIERMTAPSSSLSDTSNVAAVGAGGPFEEDFSVGCLPCARAHFATVAGTLKEALRFAREGGIADPEVQSRLEAAEEDITVIERHDWTPEKILRSPREQQEVMRQMLPELRQLRQEVIGISSVEDLERAAAKAGELSTRLRLDVLRLAGVDTDRVVELAKKVANGDMTMEEAKTELGGEAGA